MGAPSSWREQREEGWSEHPSEAELQGLQIGYQQAFVDRDEELLRAYRADEWTVVFPDGRRVSREEVERTFVYYRRELAEVVECSVRFIAKDAAIIKGLVRERFRFNDQLFDGLFRFTDVMVRRGTWQCVASQFTLAEDLLS